MAPPKKWQQTAMVPGMFAGRDPTSALESGERIIICGEDLFLNMDWRALSEDTDNTGRLKFTHRSPNPQNMQYLNIE